MKNIEKSRKRISRETNWQREEGVKREKLFAGAQKRMIEKLVRGGYLERRGGGEYTEEFKEKLMEEDSLSLWTVLEKESGEKMFFFDLRFMPGEVMQAVYTPDKSWQASLVREESNELGEPVIKAERLNERNRLCGEVMRVTPGQKARGSQGGGWQMRWSRGWRSIKEDEQFKEELVDFVESKLSIFGSKREVSGY